MTLSPVMREAYARATAAGALHRWPGGFWTDRAYTHREHFAMLERAPAPAVPDWSVPAQTVRALSDRGLLLPADWNVPAVGGRRLAIARVSRTGATPCGAGATDPRTVPASS